MTAITVGDLTITPHLDQEVVDVHPALGVVDDAAYVGVWIPCTVTGKAGLTAHKDLLYLVTDQGHLVLANEAVFSAKGWRLPTRPIRFPNRWSLPHVRSFLTGAVHVNPDVAPAQVFQRVHAAWTRYIEFGDPREALYQSLWAIGTYFHRLFKTYPYNYVTGPKRTGKTKCLTLLACLCFNAFFSNNMSTSSLYRLIQNARGTLLIDETEKLSNPERALDFRSILLSGYKQGALVYRIEKTGKDQLVPEAFEVYGPKGLANIGGVEDVLEDRCKVTVLRRSINRAITDRLLDMDDDQWRALRNDLHLLYLGYWRPVKALYEAFSVVSDVSDDVSFLVDTWVPQADREYLMARELELWVPIFALAAFFDHPGAITDDTTPQRTQTTPSPLLAAMVALACDAAKQRHIDNLTETGEEILSHVLLELVSVDGYYRVKDIRDAMAHCFDEEQRWLTTRWIGRALKRLGFTEKRRLGTGREYRLTIADVTDLAQRMGVEDAPGYSQGTSMEAMKDVTADASTLDLPRQEAMNALSQSLAETIQRLRTQLSRPFREDDFVAHAITLGLREDHAVQLFARLRGSRILMDPEGYWQWV